MDDNEDKDNTENSRDGSTEEDEAGENETKIDSELVPEKNDESDVNSPEDNSNQSENETANKSIAANDKDLESGEKSNDLDANSKTTKSKTPVKGHKRKSSEENSDEKASDKKTSCQHLTKNFKIVKKKYHCPDCNGIVCPECLTVIPTTLVRHLQNADSNDYKIYPCKLCDLFFLSKCALQVRKKNATKHRGLLVIFFLFPGP